MPITDQDVSDLQAAIQAGNYGENANIQALANLGFKLRTEAEETSFLENYATTKKGEVVSEVAANLEKDIFETTGIEKKPNEKYYEYLKRAAGSTKAELDRLKTAKTGTEADRQRITELESLLQNKDQEKEAALNELTGKYAQKEIAGTVNGAISAIKATFKPMDGNILDDVIDARRRRFLDVYKPELNSDGVTIFKDKDGKTVNGPDYKPATADYLVKDFFKDLVEAKKEQGGAGSGTPPAANPGAGDPGTPPATVTSKSKLADWLKNDAKLKPASKEYSDAFDKYGKTLPLRD